MLRHINKYIHMYTCCCIQLIFCYSANAFHIAEINICESHPCKNGANCTQAEGMYFCACPPGYTGLNCDVGKCDFSDIDIS